MNDDRVIWSNKYDRINTDIFEIQDEIVTKKLLDALWEKSK